MKRTIFAALFITITIALSFVNGFSQTKEKVEKNTVDTNKMKSTEVNGVKVESDFLLSDNEKQELLMIARTSLEQYIKYKKFPKFDNKITSEKLKELCGAIVTLKIDGNLRGSAVRFIVEDPLYKVVQDLAVEASTEDTRYNPVTPKEMSKIEIEITVISPLKKISSLDELELGKHGIYLKRGFATGYYLPQVAKEKGWTKEDMLTSCSQEKAGLGTYGWKDKKVEIYVFTTIIFSEKEFSIIKK